MVVIFIDYITHVSYRFFANLTFYLKFSLGKCKNLNTIAIFLIFAHFSYIFLNYFDIFFDFGLLY